jgi:hypothetical protein
MSFATSLILSLDTGLVSDQRRPCASAGVARFTLATTSWSSSFTVLIPRFLASSERSFEFDRQVELAFSGRDHLALRLAGHSLPPTSEGRRQ